MNWFLTNKRLDSGFCSFSCRCFLAMSVLRIDYMRIDIPCRLLIDEIMFNCFADGIINTILIHGYM